MRRIRNFRLGLAGSDWALLAVISFCLAFWGLVVMILRGLFA